MHLGRGETVTMPHLPLVYLFQGHSKEIDTAAFLFVAKAITVWDSFENNGCQLSQVLSIKNRETKK